MQRFLSSAIISPPGETGEYVFRSLKKAILSLVDEDFARACLMQYGMKRLEELRREEANKKKR
jgi:hypothetical protein